MGPDGYRVPARKKFLGTGGYRVPGKFSLIPTPDPNPNILGNLLTIHSSSENIALNYLLHLVIENNFEEKSG